MGCTLQQHNNKKRKKSKELAIMPRNAALRDPVDLQSERPSMNGATFINILDNTYYTQRFFSSNCTYT